MLCGGLCNRVCASYKTAVVGEFQNNLFAPGAESSSIGSLPVVCQEEFTHRIIEVTNKASNSFEQERLEHLVSLYSAITSPSLPCSPSSSILIDGYFADFGCVHVFILACIDC